MVKDRKQSRNIGGSGYEVRNKLERLGGKQNEATNENRSRGRGGKGDSQKGKRGAKAHSLACGLPRVGALYV